jgi:hypothetical protein
MSVGPGAECGWTMPVMPKLGAVSDQVTSCLEQLDQLDVAR